MSQNESQPLENYGKKLSEPMDLISVRNIVYNPIYKHVHLSKPKLQYFEDKGYIKTYKNTRGAKCVSLKEIELFFERNFISYCQALKLNEHTQDLYGNKMSPSFLNFAMEDGIEFVKRGNEILIHKKSLQDFINKIISKSYPFDLVSFNQVKSDEKYNHIKMSHDKLNTLEKKGLISTYIPSSNRAKFTSVSELESFIIKELEETKTLITFNTLESSDEYKHLYLNWDKTTDLVKTGELVFAETLYGYKAVTIESLKKYIKKLEAPNEEQDFALASVALKTLKEKYAIFKDDLTPSFLNYAITNGIRHEKKGKNILVDLEEFENFTKEFKSKWVSNKEATKMLNVNIGYLNEQREKRDIPNLKIANKSFYPRSFINSALIRITEQKKREEQIKKSKALEKTKKEELKKFGHTASVDNALLYLNKNGVNVSTIDDLITLCTQLNIDIITGNNKKKLIHWLNLRKIVNEYVPFNMKKSEIINFCKEKSISLFSVNNLSEKIIHNDDFKLILSHFYYSNGESRRLLSANNNQFNKIIQNYIEHQNILIIKYEERYFQKELIDNLIIQQNSYFTKWMGSQEAYQYLNDKTLSHYSNKNKRIKTIDAPVLVRPLLISGKLYFRKDVMDIYNELEINKQFDSLDLSNPVDVFEIAVNQIYKLKFEAFTPHTEKIWFNFVKTKLYESNMDEQHTKSLIKQLIYCTELLIKATAKLGKEIFSFYSNDINHLLLGPKEIPKAYKKIFTSFFTELHSQLQELAKLSGKKLFNLDNLLTNHLKSDSKRIKTIYKFQDFLDLYDYANDIKLHKTKAINDVRLNIKGQSCSRYDSMWLFIITNLNNPWNHGDIINLPSIDLSLTKITDLEWLEQNEIDYEDAHSIVKQVENLDSKRLKSGIQQNFLISPELEKAFATAASICELRRQNESSVQQLKLIDFKTTAQKLKHTHRPYVEFFREFKRDFRYENLKLSRTLISFKNVVLTEFVNPDDESIKHARGHSKLETTNIYVQIPDEHLDFLCKQLFSRDFFGNVYYKLSEIFYGETKDRTEQTKRIMGLKDRFGKILRVEGIASVINDLSNDRKAVYEKINGMDTDLAKSLHLRISCNSMPAKEENYQCLNYPKGCLYPSRSCSMCPLSIGNYLAVTKIFENLMSNIYKALNIFKTGNEQEKIVISNHLHQNLLKFGACVTQFTDKDINEIYNLISIDRDDFKTFLATLPYQQYITYHQRLEV